MRIAAHLLSWALHPLLVPSLLFLVLARIQSMTVQFFVPSLWIFLVMFVLTGILPGLNFVLFRMMGTIRSLHLPERKDRVMPFMFTTMVYAGSTYLFFNKIPVPDLLRMMLLVSAVCAAGTLTTLLFKVSIHALSCSAAAGVMTFILIVEGDYQLLLPVIVSWILTGAVMSARLMLQAHKPSEVYFGSLLGLSISGSGMYLLF